MNINHYFVNVDFEKSEVSLNKVKLPIEKGIVQYHKGVVSVKNLHLKDTHYEGDLNGSIDLNRYVALIQESLQYLRPGKETLPDLKIDEKVEEEVVEEKEKSEIIEETTEPKEETVIRDEKPKVIETETKDEAKEEEDKFLEIENTVLETIKQIEGEDGAPWDLITEKCEKAGLDKDSIEEALTSLMDKGLIYEPILGTIKTT